MKKAILHSLLFLFLLPVYCYSQTNGFQHPGSMTSIYGSGTQEFLIFKPADSITSTRKHPLIIFLQGAGEVGAGVNTTADKGIARYCANGATMSFQNPVDLLYYTFYVLTPYKPSGGDGSWESFRIKDMIAWAKDSLYNLDSNRIYLTGLSLGGGGVWDFISNDSAYWHNKLAAAAPICAFGSGNTAKLCSNIDNADLPVTAIHCKNDGTVGVGYTLGAKGYLDYCTPAVTPRARFLFPNSGGHQGAWELAYDMTNTKSVQVDSTIGYSGNNTAVGSATATYTNTLNLYQWFLSKARTPSGNPAANAGSDDSVYTTTATLTGSGTPVSPDTIQSYSWQQISGPNTATIASASSATTGISNLVVGVYVFRLTVTGGNNLTGTDDVQVTVLSPNPVAHAGSDQVITLPTSSTTLSGSGTAVNGASISSYAWVKAAGSPAGGDISNSALPGPTITNLQEGIYNYILTVKDNHDSTGKDTVKITVNAANGAYYGMDSIRINGRNCLVKRPTEDPYYSPSKPYPLLLQIGDQNENLASNPSGLSGLYKSGVPKRLSLGLPIYPNDKNGHPIYYIMVKIQPANYSDVVYADVLIPFFNAVMSAYPIDSSTNTAGQYKYIMLTGLEHGADAWFNCTNWASGLGLGNEDPVRIKKVRKIVTSRLNNISNGNPAASYTPTVFNGFNGKTLRYFEPNDAYRLPDHIKDSITKYSNAYQQLFRLSLTNAQVYDSMFSVLGSDSITNIYRLLVDDSSSAVNTPPIANAGADQNISLPQDTARLTGSGTAISPAVSISDYSWAKVSGPTGGAILNANSATTRIDNLQAGTYVYSLTVTDDLGITGSDVVTIIVASGAYYGMDSIRINGRNCLVKRPTEDPEYSPTRAYPLLLQIGDQNENLANNPSGLSGLYKSGVPKRLSLGLPIYPNDKNGNPIYYIMVKIQPANYSDVVYADVLIPFFDGVMSAYPIDSSTNAAGQYKYIMVTGLEHGADAWFNCTNWASGLGLGNENPVRIKRIRKIVTSRLNNISNGNPAASYTPAVFNGFNGKTLRYFEPNDAYRLPDHIKDSITKYSNAYQQLFRLSLTNAQVYDSMFSVLGSDSIMNIYRLLVDDESTSGVNAIVQLPSTDRLPVESDTRTKTGLFIYPNPVNGNVRITNTTGVRSIVLYGMAGQQLLIRTPATNEGSTLSIDMTKIPQGLYLLRITDKNGNIQTTKLIKN